MIKVIFLILAINIVVLANDKEDKIYNALDVYAKVLSHVEKIYYKDVNLEELIYKSIKDMVVSLDPHSEYLTEKEYKEFNGNLSGEKFGIGIEYKVEEDEAIITRVYKGSPADKLGLKKNMSIEKINEVSIFQKDKEAIDELINGKLGSSLSLTYFFKNRFKTVKLIRDKIDLDVIENFEVNSKILYVKINSFQKNITKKFLSLALKNKNKSIIIDLRDNPGGYLNEAISLADLFIEKGVIISSKERNKKEEFYKASKKTPLKGIKVVILINSETASSAEIFTGAMKEHKKAILIGERSFGKGSIQSVLRIKNNGALKITVALYYTPKHNTIQAKGITPHIEIPKYFVMQKKEREEDIKNIIKDENKNKENNLFPNYLKDDKQFITAVNFLNN